MGLPVATTSTVVQVSAEAGMTIDTTTTQLQTSFESEELKNLPISSSAHLVLVPWLRVSVEPLLSKNLKFIPLFRGAPYGFGMLAAGIILAIMILPIITSISRDVLKAIPTAQREAALAWTDDDVLDVFCL